MKRAYLILIACLCCLVHSIDARSQLQINDSTFYNQSLDTLKEFYKKEIGENLQLYNGSQYLPYGGRVKGFAFFANDSPQHGDIFYDGKFYQDVKMRYDLEKDEVIVENYSENFPIKLVTQKIKYFILLNHYFVRLGQDSASGQQTADGFFDQIYADRYDTVLVKRTKKLEMPLTTEVNVPEYKQYDTYYIILNGQPRKLESTRSVPGILKDKKGQLKKFIRGSHFSRKKILDDDIKEVMDYYNKLKNQ